MYKYMYIQASLSICICTYIFIDIRVHMYSLTAFSSAHRAAPMASTCTRGSRFARVGSEAIRSADI